MHARVVSVTITCNCKMMYLCSFALLPFQNRCYPFQFNGCGGNSNRFDSLSDCYTTCRDNNNNNNVNFDGQDASSLSTPAFGRQIPICQRRPQKVQGCHFLDSDGEDHGYYWDDQLGHCRLFRSGCDSGANAVQDFFRDLNSCVRACAQFQGN